MGFNVTALAQKARTQTIIVDSDLDMGQYDVIATDVKGDTAEFSEFVGGVGNFESGLISGGLDVGDILHAESSMQIDGDLVVEGAINNVNITNEGAISTAKSVTATGGFVGKLTGNVTGSISGGTVAGSTGTFSGAVTGASFNGLKLSTTPFVVTVTPSNNWFKMTSRTSSSSYNDDFMLTILPLNPLLLYTGSIVVNTGSNNFPVEVTAITENNTFSQLLSNASGSTEKTVSFTRIRTLYIVTGQTYDYATNMFKIPVFSFN